MSNVKDIADRFLSEQDNKDKPKVKQVTVRKDHKCNRCKTDIIKGSFAIVESRIFPNPYDPNTNWYSSKYFHLICWDGILTKPLPPYLDDLEIINPSKDNQNQ